MVCLILVEYDIEVDLAKCDVFNCGHIIIHYN